MNKMTEQEIWNNEDAICLQTDTLDDISIPPWIEQDITPSTVAAIVHGGKQHDLCRLVSPRLMAEHGDDVLQFIKDEIGELPQPARDESWSGIAVYYLSHAVELWASTTYSRLTDS